MAEDVLQDDHRVVDEAGERKRQPTQNHRVDGIVTQGETDERGQRGKRNRQEHRHRGPHAPQKDQDHRPRQQQPDRSFVNQVLDRAANERRLVEGHLGDELLRHVQQVRDAVLDTVDHGDRIGIASLLHDREIHGGLPVHPHDVVLDLRGVFSLADVGDQHGRVADGLQR